MIIDFFLLSPMNTDHSVMRLHDVDQSLLTQSTYMSNLLLVCALLSNTLVDLRE